MHQPGQFQQIRDTEERTMLAEDDLRVRRDEIRPLSQNSADRPILDLQQEALSGSVRPFAHANELLAAERMKGMGDAHKVRRSHRNVCILD